MKSFHSEELNNFYEAVLTLKNTNECGRFFEDICTVKELQDIAQRLEVAKMLKNGKNYQMVSQEVGASTATISRVNKCLVYGNGGYEIVLDRISKPEEY